MWVVSRTVGIPLGPAAGEVEGMGALDVISTATEVALVVLLMGLLNLYRSGRVAHTLRRRDAFGPASKGKGNSNPSLPTAPALVRLHTPPAHRARTGASALMEPYLRTGQDHDFRTMGGDFPPSILLGANERIGKEMVDVNLVQGMPARKFKED